MAAQIHPTAVVDPSAELGEGVAVGAFAVVGAGVRLGAGTVLHHHAVVDGDTWLGASCEVFPFACIGLKTQDLKYRGGRPGVRIGDANVFREFVTVHAATNDGEYTVIGSHNHFLAYAHVAHDCRIGSHVVCSNNATFAGHVVVGDHVVWGGLAAAHQFCRIGNCAMIGGMSKVVQDVPPFTIADGNPALVRSINKVGLERAGFTPEQMSHVKQAYRIFYRSGLNRAQAIEALAADPSAPAPEIQLFLDFARSSERGLAPGSSRG